MNKVVATNEEISAALMAREISFITFDVSRHVPSAKSDGLPRTFRGCEFNGQMATKLTSGMGSSFIGCQFGNQFVGSLYGGTTLENLLVYGDLAVDGPTFGEKAFPATLQGAEFWRGSTLRLSGTVEIKFSRFHDKSSVTVARSNDDTKKIIFEGCEFFKTTFKGLRNVTFVQCHIQQCDIVDCYDVTVNNSRVDNYRELGSKLLFADDCIVSKK